jgi:hypothetical protein
MLFELTPGAIRPTKQFILRQMLVGLATAALLASTVAEAQWVLLARKAVGRVQQMSQQQPNGGAAYDSAAVMIEVPAEKVYTVAVRNIKAAAGITVTEQNDTQRLIQFSNGVQIAGLQVNALSDNLSQLMITSAHSGTQQNAAAMILDRVLKLCAEMSVECSRSQN